MLRYLLKIQVKRLFPRPMIKFLKGMNKKELVGVEIGTYQGINSRSILKTLDIKKLYLIDPWDNYKEYGDNNPFGDLKKAEEKVRSLQRNYMFHPSIIINIIKGFSNEVANQIPNELDFVYIDGNHSYDFVKEDIDKYYPKLKKGGVMGGHDFYNGFCEEHSGIIKAVIEFAIKNNLKLYVEHPDWFMIKS